MKTYLLVVWGDVEPELIECKNFDERDQRAKKLKAEHGDDNGLFMLTITPCGEAVVDAYSGEFFNN